MDRHQHAAKLRAAMGLRNVQRTTVADYVGVDVRTVTNWTSEKKPTMPAEHQRVALRRLLGEYDTPGDPVEVAVRGSSLVEWRQDDTIAHYKKHLYEQAREEAV